MSDDSTRLGHWNRFVQEEVDGEYVLKHGTYTSGGKQFQYWINLKRADALHTGIDLYPIIYPGWISEPNGTNKKEASFIQFTDKSIADKYCGLNLDDPSFLPSYLPSSIHDESISNSVFVCVRRVQGFWDLTDTESKASLFPVFGNPTTWAMKQVKNLVQVFLAMVNHDACNSLWNWDGCYLVSDGGKIKVIVDQFKEDHTIHDWNSLIAHNLLQLVYGLHNMFLSPEVDWPLRDSFLRFFDPLNSNKFFDPSNLIATIEDWRKHIERILTHPFLMEDPWDILQLAHSAFQSLDVIRDPTGKYWMLYLALSNGSFIRSLNSGRFIALPNATSTWLFYSPLIRPFEDVYHFKMKSSGTPYDHTKGLHFSLYVRRLLNNFQGTIDRRINNVNPNGVTPYAAHREMEMIFPGFFHRLHEFT